MNHLRRLVVILCLGVAPALFAVTPPPGGGYPANNTALGEDALFSLTTGGGDTALGYHALYADEGGFGNTAVGELAMAGTIGGVDNLAVGNSALASKANGDFNTALGFLAMVANTDGVGNTATGTSCLYKNTTGSYNTASGYFALYNCTTGSGNVASGFAALNGTNGSNNTAIGTQAMLNNLSGTANTVVGYDALDLNQSGANNTALGFEALAQNSDGSGNLALGNKAGYRLRTGSNNIDIANAGVNGDSGVIRIGTVGTAANAFLAGVNGVTVAGGVAVIVDNQGHLGTITSSARYKEAIKPMEKASEALLKLQPVTFRYNKALDPEAIPQFGLVAEQVAKVDPDLVALDASGKPYTVRYEAVNAMLLNEFLKEHKTVESLQSTAASLEATVAEQKQEIAQLIAGLKAQAAQIQKVSSAVATGQAEPRVVANQ